MSKEVEVTVVEYDEYTQYDFQDISTFYFKDAVGNRHYIHTSKRSVAQEVADEYSGVKGKYVVIATRTQKPKSKLESGGQSVYATATRAKPSSRAPK